MPVRRQMEQLQNTPQLKPSLNLLLPWSAVRSRLVRLYVFKLSIKLKCYRFPQSRSRWISIKLSVKLKCYRGPHSSSRWRSIKLSVKLNFYRGPRFRSPWITIKLSVKLKCYRGPQSRSRWINIKLRVELKCYCGLQTCSGWKNEVYLWFLYTVYYVNYVDCGTAVAGYWVVFQLWGILKFSPNILSILGNRQFI